MKISRTPEPEQIMKLESHGPELSGARLLPSSANSKTKQRPSRWTRLGIGLMAFSALLWLPLPALPFLTLETGEKAVLGGGLFFSAEATWWLGVVLVGPEAVRRTGPWLRALVERGRRSLSR